MFIFPDANVCNWKPSRDDSNSNYVVFCDNYQTYLKTQEYGNGRPLDSCERFFLDISELCSFNIVLVAICTLSRPITVSEMKCVLRQIVIKHPLLRVKVEHSKNNRKPWFRPVQDFVIDVKELPMNNWSAIVENQFSDTSIDVKRGPCWRVNFFQDCYTYHADENHNS